MNLGYVGWKKGNRWTLCNQDTEEGYNNPGWWCGVHYGWKESSGTLWKTSIPCTTAFLFPDHGK